MEKNKNVETVMKNSEKGFSLIETIFAGALIMATVVGIMRISSSMKESSNLYQVRNQELQSFDFINSIFFDSEACKKTIQSTTLHHKFTKVTRMGGSKIRVGGDSEFVNNSRIKYLEYASENFTGCASYPCAGSITLNVKFERFIGGNTVDGPQKQINLLAKRSTAEGVIESCFATTNGSIELALEEACNLMGGNYGGNPASCTFSGEMITAKLNNYVSKDIDLQNQINNLKAKNTNLVNRLATLKGQSDSLKAKLNTLEQSLQPN